MGVLPLCAVGGPPARAVGKRLPREAFSRRSCGGGRSRQFLTEPRTEPYGQVVVFRDIAGNKWDLIGPAR